MLQCHKRVSWWTSCRRWGAGGEQHAAGEQPGAHAGGRAPARAGRSGQGSCCPFAHGHVAYSVSLWFTTEEVSAMPRTTLAMVLQERFNADFEALRHRKRACLERLAAMQRRVAELSAQVLLQYYAGVH